LSQPLLYTFRRCPYAIRARLALWSAGVRFELREVVLRDKPPSLLSYSPKATVPVVVLEDGIVIDESLDVMLWGLNQRDVDGWLQPEEGTLDDMLDLIGLNDNDFKKHLDRYKYPNRYDNVDSLHHRAEAERFLANLDQRIEAYGCLFGGKRVLADYAIGPFIRQFANTNRAWFDDTPYEGLKSWLQDFLNLPLFQSVMGKYPQWHDGDEPTFVP
jgi:glutathione S-transferase